MKNKNFIIILILSIILVICIWVIFLIATKSDVKFSLFSKLTSSQDVSSSDKVEGEVINEIEDVTINETEEIEEPEEIEEANQSSEENNINSSDIFSEILSQNANNSSSSSNSNSSTLNSTNSSNKTYLGNYEVKGTISIPKTGIEYQILNKVTADSLNQSVAILSIVSNTSLNETVTELNVKGTNTLILGHNYKNGKFFSDNYKLTNGDKIYITDNSGNKVTYVIYSMEYTEANDVSFMEREVGLNDTEITLETCNDDTTQRLIIQAKAQ
jgi:LPXTG-site transpeptidase (sortase) family protein